MLCGFIGTNHIPPVHFSRANVPKMIKIFYSIRLNVRCASVSS